MRPVVMFCGFLAVALSAGAAAAQTATQFDLACSGTRQIGVDAPVAHDYRIRVDLALSRWCWDTCERTYPLVDAAPEQIVFARDYVDSPEQRRSLENAISRVTGEHRLISIQSYPIARVIETKGQCRPEAFSGFPAAQF